MKKRFVEPAMRRIELNLRENIAASTPTTQLLVDFATQAYLCPVVDSGKFAHEVFDTEEHKALASNCLTYVQNRRLGATVPLEEVLRRVH